MGKRDERKRQRDAYHREFKTGGESDFRKYLGLAAEKEPKKQPCEQRRRYVTL